MVESQATQLETSSQNVYTDQHLKVLQRHESLFKGQLGKWNEVEAKLNLKAKAKPVFHKARPVPFAKKSKISEKLNLLESQEIIQKVQ